MNRPKSKSPAPAPLREITRPEFDAAIAALRGGYVKGGSKVGKNVWTYSRTPVETCPGKSAWCSEVAPGKKNPRCYDVKSLIYPDARDKRAANAAVSDIPSVPERARMLRIHIGGDFDSVDYVNAWFREISARPATEFWAYTRSWRVPELLPALEKLRALPNLQLFASTDPSTPEPTPAGWRVAHAVDTFRAPSLPRGLKCPEQTGRKPDCEACLYCFRGTKGDVLFSDEEHKPQAKRARAR